MKMSGEDSFYEFSVHPIDSFVTLRTPRLHSELLHDTGQQTQALQTYLKDEKISKPLSFCRKSGFLPTTIRECATRQLSSWKTLQSFHSGKQKTFQFKTRRTQALHIQIRSGENREDNDFITNNLRDKDEAPDVRTIEMTPSRKNPIQHKRNIEQEEVHLIPESPTPRRRPFLPIQGTAYQRRNEALLPLPCTKNAFEPNRNRLPPKMNSPFHILPTTNDESKVREVDSVRPNDFTCVSNDECDDFVATYFLKPALKDCNIQESSTTTMFDAFLARENLPLKTRDPSHSITRKSTGSATGTSSLLQKPPEILPAPSSRLQHSKIILSQQNSHQNQNNPRLLQNATKPPPLNRIKEGKSHIHMYEDGSGVEGNHMLHNLSPTPHLGSAGVTSSISRRISFRIYLKLKAWCRGVRSRRYEKLIARFRQGLHFRRTRLRAPFEWWKNSARAYRYSHRHLLRRTFSAIADHVDRLRILRMCYTHHLAVARERFWVYRYFSRWRTIMRHERSQEAAFLARQGILKHCTCNNVALIRDDSSKFALPASIRVFNHLLLSLCDNPSIQSNRRKQCLIVLLHAWRGYVGKRALKRSAQRHAVRHARALQCRRAWSCWRVRQGLTILFRFCTPKSHEDCFRMWRRYTQLTCSYRKVRRFSTEKSLMAGALHRWMQTFSHASQRNFLKTRHVFTSIHLHGVRKSLERDVHSPERGYRSLLFTFFAVSAMGLVHADDRETPLWTSVSIMIRFLLRLRWQRRITQQQIKHSHGLHGAEDPSLDASLHRRLSVDQSVERGCPVSPLLGNSARSIVIEGGTQSWGSSSQGGAIADGWKQTYSVTSNQVPGRRRSQQGRTLQSQNLKTFLDQRVLVISASISITTAKVQHWLACTDATIHEIHARMHFSRWRAQGNQLSSIRSIKCLKLFGNPHDSLYHNHKYTNGKELTDVSHPFQMRAGCFSTTPLELRTNRQRRPSTYQSKDANGQQLGNDLASYQSVQEYPSSNPSEHCAGVNQPVRDESLAIEVRSSIFRPLDVLLLPVPDCLVAIVFSERCDMKVQEGYARDLLCEMFTQGMSTISRAQRLAQSRIARHRRWGGVLERVLIQDNRSNGIEDIGIGI